ncbi:MAG: PTS sugar transporter subunit IIA [Desulfobacterales bacterium]|nr:PTS sugar transporter subunit IIA [Desulfobacterales bacterium]
MIGILIVTHGNLGNALIETAEFIIGSRPEFVEAVSVNVKENTDDLRGKVAKGMKKVKQRGGVLILTDMFGGTPSNLSYSFLEEGRVEVISGINLPILIKAVDSRKDMKLADLTECLEVYGKRSISTASGILKGNKRV